MSNYWGRRRRCWQRGPPSGAGWTRNAKKCSTGRRTGDQAGRGLGGIYGRVRPVKPPTRSWPRSAKAPRRPKGCDRKPMYCALDCPEKGRRTRLRPRYVDLAAVRCFNDGATSVGAAGGLTRVALVESRSRPRVGQPQQGGGRMTPGAGVAHLGGDRELGPPQIVRSAAHASHDVKRRADTEKPLSEAAAEPQ